jgi:hypothetical protein
MDMMQKLSGEQEEADKEGDESPDSFASLACAGGTGVI